MPAWFPLETDHDADPLRTLIQAASGLSADEAACVQVLARPATHRQIARLRQGVQSLRTGRPPRQLLDPATWLRGALNLGGELIGPGRRTPHPNTGRYAANLPAPTRNATATPGPPWTNSPGRRYGR
jgi:hypothetical protein